MQSTCLSVVFVFLLLLASNPLKYIRHNTAFIALYWFVCYNLNMDAKLDLKPITNLDIDWLDKTEYKNLSLEQRKSLVLDSEQSNHNGNFFRFFLVQYGQENVGVISMCGHGEKVISVAPEIIMEHRGKGFALKSLQMAYKIAKNLGF